MHSITGLFQLDKEVIEHLGAVESLDISGCKELEFLWSIREGCFTHLTRLEISFCDHIESIPENGFGFLPQLCLRYLTISGCRNLKSITHKHFQSLTSLEELEIVDCPSMDDTFPCKLWPPNLSFLKIGNLKKPISKWGFQNFPTSLSNLQLLGKNSGLVSFAKEEDVINISNSTSSLFLPSSLTSLRIGNFEDLEVLLEGLQHLNRLDSLEIWSCPKLRDLPKTLLPSLSRLRVYNSPELEKRCRDREGEYWPIISEIDDCDIY